MKLRLRGHVLTDKSRTAADRSAFVSQRPPFKPFALLACGCGLTAVVEEPGGTRIPVPDAGCGAVIDQPAEPFQRISAIFAFARNRTLKA